MLAYLSLGAVRAGKKEKEQLGGLCVAAPLWVTAWRLQDFAEGVGWRWLADAAEDTTEEAQALFLHGEFGRAHRGVCVLAKACGEFAWASPSGDLAPSAGPRCEVHVAKEGTQRQCGGTRRQTGSSRLHAGAGLAARAVLE